MQILGKHETMWRVELSFQRDSSESVQLRGVGEFRLSPL